MANVRKMLRAICCPTKKFLFFFSLGYYAAVAIFMFLLFVLDNEVKGVFMIIWTAMFALLGAYILYGYIRLITIKALEKKRAEGVVKALKTDKTFRGIFLRAGGVAANYAFVGWYLGRSLVIDSSFYWLLAEFYWFAAIIKIYLDYGAEHKSEKRRYASCLLANCLLVCLALIVMFITLFVIRFDGIFQKSWTTVFPIAAFTVFKIVSACFALKNAVKTKNSFERTFASATFSCALYSLFTLLSAMLVLFSGETQYKKFSYFGFAVATVIFALSVWGIVVDSVKINKLSDNITANDDK